MSRRLQPFQIIDNLLTVRIRIHVAADVRVEGCRVLGVDDVVVVVVGVAGVAQSVGFEVGAVVADGLEAEPVGGGRSAGSRRTRCR